MINRRTLLKLLGSTVPTFFFNKYGIANDLLPRAPFDPHWNSLERYQVPDWFRDAKFGIWAHWGPQCEPERGDWYARGMYQEGSDQYQYHRNTYGHPSVFGFKDIINAWTADQWDPQELMQLYKKAGAQYFVGLANHHDNFDLYASTHHRWNSLNMGPKKDLVKGWADAAKQVGLKFGVSVHAAHAWTWYETAQRSDKNGEFKGIPYDGKTTMQDGRGKWWEGFDPQELYAQNHDASAQSEDDSAIHRQWHWDINSGVSIPSTSYCENFKKRTFELIDRYQPDILYFDDTVLPLWPISNVGLEIAAKYYNKSASSNSGKPNVVITGKILNEQQRKSLVWDIERGQSNTIEPIPWQTCTCLGAWHYDRRIYENDGYKSAKMVVHMLIDVVSKNGNLLLSVPLRGNGSLDEKARKVVEDMASWMSIHQEAIVGTRPWDIFGEGPAQRDAPELNAQGFNEGKGKKFTSDDVRFTAKEDVIYAFVMGQSPSKTYKIKSLGKKDRKVKQVNSVTILGYPGKIRFKQSDAMLEVFIPEELIQNPIANVLKII